jgi:hypothetical protein
MASWQKLPSMPFRLNRITLIRESFAMGKNLRSDGMNGAVLALFFCSLTLALFQSCSSLRGATVPTDNGIVEWQLGALNASSLSGESKIGNPSTISSPYGEAVQFDGKGDGLFLEKNPLVNLRHFTVEVLFRPDPNGQTEQRFLQMGEVNGERMMLETRLTEDNQWYLDAYIKSGDSSKALIDKNKLHPAGEWCHIAFVVDDGKMDTYVAGKHELEGRVVPFSPFQRGRTSIGVRMNKVYWFKGAIARIRITPKSLTPSEFTMSR